MYLHLRALASWYHHGDVATVEENMRKFRYSFAFRSEFELCYINQHHVNITVETEESSNHFLVVLHDYVYT